jgi:hypothetical protein
MLAAALSAAPAAAQPIQVWFTGTITSNTPHALLGSLTAGDAFQGGFTYHIGAPDDDARPGFGFFQNVITGFWIDFGPGKGGMFAQGGPQTYNNIQIGNDRTDYGATPFDGFYAYGNMSIPGYSYAETGLSLQSMLDPLTNEGLPAAGIDWSRWLGAAGGPYPVNGIAMGAGMEFHAVFGQGCGPDSGFVDDCAVSAYGTLNGLRASVAPEPMSMVLVAVGLVLAVVVRPPRADRF